MARCFKDQGAGALQVEEEGNQWMRYEEWQCRIKEHELELLRLREQIVLLEGVTALVRVCAWTRLCGTRVWQALLIGALGGACCIVTHSTICPSQQRETKATSTGRP